MERLRDFFCVGRLRDLNLNSTFNSTMKIIMSRQSFRHLELQNLFTGDDFIKKNPQKFFLVPFFTTMEVVAPLENDPILSGTSIR